MLSSGPNLHSNEMGQHKLNFEAQCDPLNEVVHLDHQATSPIPNHMTTRAQHGIYKHKEPYVGHMEKINALNGSSSSSLSFRILVLPLNQSLFPMHFS